MHAPCNYITFQQTTHQMPESVKEVVGKWEGHQKLKLSPQELVGGERLKRAEELRELLSTDEILQCDQRNDWRGEY